jgi:hypothetical protein
VHKGDVRSMAVFYAPAEMVGLVIGKQGAHIKSVEDQTGARIGVSTLSLVLSVF